MIFIEPLTNPIALIFSLAIAIVFIASLIRSIKRGGELLPFDRYAPTALTTLGVVGTFTGIYVGLTEFNIENIDGSIPQLLDGLKIAFFTSILGMATSIALKITQSAIPHQSSGEKESVTAKDIYQAMIEVRDEAQASREQSEKLLNEVKGAIAGEGESSLVTQIQKLRTTTQDGQLEVKTTAADGFAKITEEFRSFADKMAENNSKALIEALQEVILDFNQKITEQFGDNFKQLNEAVGALLTWQENYKAQVESMLEQFSEVNAGIATTRDAVADIKSSAQEIPTTMEALKQVIELADNQIEVFNNHLETLAGLREKAVEAFPVIEENIAKMTTDFSSAVENNASLITEVMGKQSEAMQQAATNSITMLEQSSARHQEALEKLESGMIEIPNQVNVLVNQVQDGFAEAVHVFAKNIEVSMKGQSDAIQQNSIKLREGLENSLQEANSVIQESFTTFDNQMQEEIQRTIETMGGHLASLSNQFVQDYTPLTEQLSRVVNMARDIQRN